MNATVATACVLWAVCAGPAPGAPSLSVERPGWSLSALLRQALPAPAQPLPAVVRVVVTEKDGTSYGSGTLVDVHGRYGLVITNWHVVSEASGPIAVHFPDGFQSAAHVVKQDRDWDLAAVAIWKPRVEPLPLAARAPQPGQLLTICGYGNGPYRMVSGRCTQYLSPGPELPSEIVELSAASRQGDSGGPILNENGELAGVLFGESKGLTSGSHCGRVRLFLDSVLAGKHNAQIADTAPDERNAPDATNAGELQPNADKSPGPAGPTGDDDAMAPDQAPWSAEAPSQGASAESAAAGLNPDGDQAQAAGEQYDGLPDELSVDEVERRVMVDAETATRRLPSLPSRSMPEQIGGPLGVEGPPPLSDAGSASDWVRALGASPLEQGKSVLAIVGLLAIALRVGRWMFPR